MSRKGGMSDRSHGPSQRQLRAGELVRHALVEVLTREELRDRDLAGVSITVSEVRMSPDLRQATCFVMPLGGGHREEVLHALDRIAPWLGSQVARRVRTKFAPRLRFQLDASFDEASRIDQLLQRADVARDLHHDDEDEAENGSGGA
jgi:ribosome-binding factor A